MSPKNISIKPHTATKQTIRWDYLAAISGVMGLILAFIPYLSLIGIFSGVAAIVLSILAFRKNQKKIGSWFGLITGILTVLALIIVMGLIIFF